MPPDSIVKQFNIFKDAALSSIFGFVLSKVSWALFVGWRWACEAQHH